MVVEVGIVLFVLGFNEQFLEFQSDWVIDVYLCIMLWDLFVVFVELWFFFVGVEGFVGIYVVDVDVFDESGFVIDYQQFVVIVLVDGLVFVQLCWIDWIEFQYMDVCIDQGLEEFVWGIDVVYVVIYQVDLDFFFLYGDQQVGKLVVDFIVFYDVGFYVDVIVCGLDGLLYGGIGGWVVDEQCDFVVGYQG